MKARDIYDYRIPWTPTPAAFKEYLTREVQLAQSNLMISNETLHSKQTIRRAKYFNTSSRSHSVLLAVAALLSQGIL